MKVKVTEVMRKYLQASIPEYRFTLEKMSRDAYAMKVDYRTEWHTTDYDFYRGYMKAIRVDYSEEYYAIPRYITTSDLVSALVASDRTAEGFVKAVKNAIAI